MQADDPNDSNKRPPEGQGEGSPSKKQAASQPFDPPHPAFIFMSELMDLDTEIGRLERIEASRRANLSNVPAGDLREGYMGGTMMINATIAGLKLRRSYVWNRFREAINSF